MTTSNQTIIESVLKKFPKAKRIAVENFTCGCTKLDMATEMNLRMDTQLYNWNSQTVAAIREVIRKNGQSLHS